jgi:hypothetical protein
VPQEPSPTASADEYKSAAILKAAFVVRERIFSLRGQIISGANDIEGSIDLVLSMYFVQPESTRRFSTWILSRIPLSAKIDVLEDVTAELGLSDHVQDALRRLRRASDLRNDLAHSTVTFNTTVPAISEATMEEFAQWHSHRVTRRGVRDARIEADHLARQAIFVDAVGVDVMRILAALLMRRQGVDAEAAFADFDRLNAKLLRVTVDLEASL